ncbi:class I SAM-dependent methyltransferase [Luteococcus sp. Sow4_B9]|uniref:class I SAM-dependent methyltransferase n=1 Tax=Luteococcus sp. Sow4_B9 TaxID=3438792 RepID=UPI003F97B25D
MADWSSYLDSFHAQRPGIADEVFKRCVSGNKTPYRWLARAVSSRALQVLDIGCGAGAMGRELELPGRIVVGLDRSAAELRHASGPGPFVQGDARALPFADGSFDAVVSVLELAVIHPTGRLLDEVQRVLRPGGVFVGLVPTLRPLNPRDMRVAGQLTRLLRGTPEFPGQVELRVAGLLADHGLRKVEDARERYHYRVGSREDAERLLQGFYLPNTSPQRVQAAADWMTSRAEAGEDLRVPIPLRRVAAIK